MEIKFDLNNNKSADENHFDHINAYVQVPFDESWLYTGHMRDDNGTLVPHGQGQLTHKKDGRVIEGRWTNGKISEGTIKCTNGSIYRGALCDYLPEGNGIFQDKNGSLYQGEWHKGNIVKGTYTDPNTAEVYIGKFKNNHKHGHGELYKNSVLIHAGYFVRGNIAKTEEQLQDAKRAQEDELNTIFEQNDRQFA